MRKARSAFTTSPPTPPASSAERLDSLFHPRHARPRSCKTLVPPREPVDWGPTPVHISVPPAWSIAPRHRFASLHRAFPPSVRNPHLHVQQSSPRRRSRLPPPGLAGVNAPIAACETVSMRAASPSLLHPSPMDKQLLHDAPALIGPNRLLRRAPPSTLFRLAERVFIGSCRLVHRSQHFWRTSPTKILLYLDLSFRKTERCATIAE